MAKMSLEEFVSFYESLENNKELYLGYIEQFKTRMNESIMNHDLESLDGIMSEYYDLNNNHDNELLISDFIKINQIISALNNEKKYGFKLFWEDVCSIDELIDKYNKTALMLRRVTFDLLDDFKIEALEYLADISPFIVKAAYDDNTNVLGMEERVYITLARNSLNNSKPEYASIYLELAKSINNNQ